ncbi:hypothetical protein [Nonomuraea sp. NPDC049784]|uniref:hypothetical protein n=1 Tax=Nonomuraea sp. NPDC049784 TaxID=3154361 RepID=UPI0033E1A943
MSGSGRSPPAHVLGAVRLGEGDVDVEGLSPQAGQARVQAGPQETTGEERVRDRAAFAALARLSSIRRAQDAERRHVRADTAHRYADAAAARLRRLIDQRGERSPKQQDRFSPPT